MYKCDTDNDKIPLQPLYPQCTARETRQSEMANTSPRHMPVLGNVHPIKIEKKRYLGVTSFLCSLEFFILLIDTATQEVPMKNI